MKRLWYFLGIGIGLPIIILVLLYHFTGPIYVAAFLGAWPVSAIAFYDHFVNVSLVTFDRRSVWKDSLQMINRGGVTWNFLRLPVENIGFAPARNCTAELRVLKRPEQASQSCPAPSAEPKTLTWVAPKLEDRHTIPSRRGTAALAIVIDDTNVTSTARSSWHAANAWGPLTLWAGTNEVFAMSPATRAQDAFCQGDYEIEVTVFPENGAPKTETFKLHVDSDWNKTALDPEEQKSKLLSEQTNWKYKYIKALAISYFATCIALFGASLKIKGLAQVIDLVLAVAFSLGGILLLLLGNRISENVINRMASVRANHLSLFIGLVFLGLSILAEGYVSWGILSIYLAYAFLLFGVLAQFIRLIK